MINRPSDLSLLFLFIGRLIFVMIPTSVVVIKVFTANRILICCVSSATAIITNLGATSSFMYNSCESTARVVYFYKYHFFGVIIIIVSIKKSSTTPILVLSFYI